MKQLWILILTAVPAFGQTVKPVIIDGINGQHPETYLVHSDGKVISLKEVHTWSYLEDVGLTVVGIDYGSDTTFMHVRIGKGVEGPEPTNERILPFVTKPFLTKLKDAITGK